MIITSKDNFLIKKVIALRDKEERQKENLIVVEGEREIFFALVAKLKLHQFFYCRDLAKSNYKVLEKIAKDKIIEVDKKVMEKISYRDNPDGYLALVEPKKITLPNLPISKNPLLIILEKIEKPGNLGAVMRTADAAKVDAVIVTDPKVDIYNPNVIRSSQGIVFTTPVLVCSNKETREWLGQNKIKIYSAALTAKKLYTEIDLRAPLAIAFGSEDQGLSKFWLNNCDAQIKIPMLGQIDSLNVSNSVAVMIYEAIRQRRI